MLGHLAGEGRGKKEKKKKKRAKLHCGGRFSLEARRTRRAETSKSEAGGGRKKEEGKMKTSLLSPSFLLRGSLANRQYFEKREERREGRGRGEGRAPISSLLLLTSHLRVPSYSPRIW